MPIISRGCCTKRRYSPGRRKLKVSGSVLLSLLICSCFLVLFPTVTTASENPADHFSGDNINTYGNGEYALTKYSIDIEVNENNTFLITEHITAHFNVNKHGIYRKLPLRNEVVRLDGTKAANRAKVSDVLVAGDQSVMYNEDGYCVIRIGNPNKTIKGSKDYSISYSYDIGKDAGKGFDEFYFNLMGYEWDTTISGIEFSITMPTDFDESKLGFSHGARGSTVGRNISYAVDGTVITGSYSGTLKAGEAITVRLELPEGYFAGAGNKADLPMILAIILPILFAGVTMLLWLKFGRDEKVINTVDFYPPEGLNSAEIGFLYKGKAEKADVVSLLIYLANQGYISISEAVALKNTRRSKSKEFIITKVKDYDGNNPNEELFLQGLFQAKSLAGTMSIKNVVSMIKNPQAMEEFLSNAQTAETDQVTSSDLDNSFYVTLNSIMESINSKENREKIFEKSSLNKNIFTVIMIITTFVIISFRPLMEYDGLGMFIMGLAFPGVGFTVVFLTLFGNIKMPKLFAVIWCSLFGGVPLAIFVLPALLIEPLYLITYIVGIICIGIMIFLLNHMKKRTAYGLEMLGKVQGFKNSLGPSEKAKLEELAMDNPSYFYNILPYTYVLGVSDKWISLFKDIVLLAPDWYYSSDPYDTFNAAVFGRFINSTMSAATSAMSSSPSSSSSGGGSSGGGSGGGGGGSW